jgi:Na+/H+-dicarboxylate symporter
MNKERKKLSSSTKMLMGLVLGILAGLVFGEKIRIIKPFGTLFINLLKMCMIPIIFTSITLAVSQVTDFKQFGRIGGKMLAMFMITTTVAAIAGTTLGKLIKPGSRFIGSAAIGEVSVPETPSVANVLLSIVPTNPIKAMANDSLLAVIFFAIMLGVSLILIEEKKDPAVNVLNSLFEAFMTMVKICLKYAPIGVFALMADLTGTLGIEVLKPLAYFFTAEYIAMLFQIIVVYGALLFIFARINIFKFLVRCKDEIVIAFTTASGNAAIPVELEQAESHFGIPNKIAGFGLTIGTTINQDGAALNIPLCVLFVAQFNGIEISMAQLITIIAMAIIMSCGASGVPASATVFTLSILSSFGIPAEAFSMILASYIIIDVGLTVVNVVGDIACVTIASKLEGELIQEVWEPGYTPNMYEAIESKAVSS